jgi:hypothetical protein
MMVQICQDARVAKVDERLGTPEIWATYLVNYLNYDDG